MIPVVMTDFDVNLDNVFETATSRDSLEKNVRMLELLKKVSVAVSTVSEEL